MSKEEQLRKYFKVKKHVFIKKLYFN